jgi:hypothetical protein
MASQISDVPLEVVSGKGSSSPFWSTSSMDEGMLHSLLHSLKDYISLGFLYLTFSFYPLEFFDLLTIACCLNFPFLDIELFTILECHPRVKLAIPITNYMACLCYSLMIL